MISDIILTIIILPYIMCYIYIHLYYKQELLDVIHNRYDSIEDSQDSTEDY